MGGWKLEVAKMALYMAFPVGLFHYFNQPKYYEEWVTSVKKEMYPPEKLGNREKIQQFIKEMRRSEEVKLLEALEKSAK